MFATWLVALQHPRNPLILPGWIRLVAQIHRGNEWHATRAHSCWGSRHGLYLEIRLTS